MVLYERDREQMEDIFSMVDHAILIGFTDEAIQVQYINSANRKENIGLLEIVKHSLIHGGQE